MSKFTAKRELGENVSRLTTVLALWEEQYGAGTNFMTDIKAESVRDILEQIIDDMRRTNGRA